MVDSSLKDKGGEKKKSAIMKDAKSSHTETSMKLVLSLSPLSEI